ncbi:rhodanese-like domain-containing protein [Hydrogenothermus marinus]|uniref:Rhodanese-related sulfurtransferase n=1 Tax=Hydrogenothermus marinus TaxID=133270 RepID=A0A3M0B960_9AQUI|nr:rhodanese-like domain-containing protein [Hydrogenothermus marinus]RMA93024.1 rhodanese-related sulfurtransferase [Hydrogenothermus marinus]
MRYILTILAFLNISFAYENLNPKQFYNLLNKTKDAILLDVRTPQEFYQEGHIPNANLIPVQLFKYIFLAGKGIKERPVFVYCRSGNRSAIASKLLEKWGVKKVYNLNGGILNWKKENLPIEK